MRKKFDATIIGSVMSRSWAVKEFCDASPKTFVLEKLDSMIMTEPWEFDPLWRLSQKDTDQHPILCS
ncbi:MAG: hypothetical protein ACJARG_000397 [Arcticibacterium sp.]|jgi:hypothetical protein